jgi:hypothetical protein
LSVEPVPPGRIVRPIDPVGVESGAAELFLRYSTMPYETGLVEGRIKNTVVDRFERIVLRVEKQRNTTGMAGKQGEVVCPLGFHPACPERPGGAFDSFPFIRCAQMFHTFVPQSL